MDKMFITCLDNIIELEKVSIIQDRTMKSLQSKISMMGKSRKIDEPEMPAVQYQMKAKRLTVILPPSLRLSARLSVL